MARDYCPMELRPCLPRFTRTGLRTGALSVLAAAAVALPTGLLGTTAAAATTTPNTPAFSSPIEAYPRWVSEQGCLSGVRPGISATIDQVLRPTYGGASWNYLTQRTCVPSSESGHDNGTSLDWMRRHDRAAERAQVDAFLRWLLASDRDGNTHANARRLGIMYLIWDDKVFKLYRASAGWTTYTRTVRGVKTPCTSLQASAYDTVCHRDHLHISYTAAGAAKQTSFWKQQAPAPTVPTTPTTPPTQTPTPTTPPTLPVEPVTSTTLSIANPLVHTRSGGTVTLRGTTVNARESVQVYVRQPGAAWKAILAPVTSDASKQWSISYTTGVTHYVQVRVGESTSNLGRVIIQ